MSQIIDPSNAYVQPPYDKVLDSPATKREVQKALDHFSHHIDALYATTDTQHIVINLIADKLNITKAELLAYVEKKRAEIEAAANAQKAQSNA